MERMFHRLYSSIDFKFARSIGSVAKCHVTVCWPLLQECCEGGKHEYKLDALQVSITEPPPTETNPSNLLSDANREPALNDRSVGSTSTSL